jgi:hypothetical protein
MAASSPIISDWNAFFRLLRGAVNEIAVKNCPLPNDRSGPERVLSIRRALDLLPVAVNIVMLDTEGAEVVRKDGRYAFVIHYDLAKPKTLHVTDHGIIALSDFERHTGLFQSVFKVDAESLGDLRVLRFSATYGYPDILHVPLYDPRTNLKHYAYELFDILCSDNIVGLFEMQYDFNSKYGLRSGTILSESELLHIDEVNRMFFHGDRDQAIKIAQERVAALQMTGRVPTEVARIFNTAKRLYIFGLFEYQFFTVSHHYAYLAIEAAVYHRWSQTQPKPFVLTHGKEQMTVHDSGRGSIARFCEDKGWNRRDVKLNGKRFPFSTASLLARLRQAGTITEFQQRQLETKLKLRNIHSHLEFGPLEMPETGVLERVAEVINALFDSKTSTI